MKQIVSIIIFATIGVFLFFGYKYIDFRNKNAVSDAAFIKSEQIATLSFKISGKVIKTFKKEIQIYPTIKNSYPFF